MKPHFLLALVLCLPALPLAAQQTLYVIDNVTVAHFDGSQLKGKTIKDYQISTSGSGKNAITVHAITTSPSVFSLYGDFSRFDFSAADENGIFYHFQADTLQLPKDSKYILDASPQYLYMIDGKQYDNAASLRDLSPEQIQSITVIKSKESFLRYGINHPVVMVETKNPQASLEELVKKLPGARMEADGSVTLNGEPVKKIIVNGKTYHLK